MRLTHNLQAELLKLKDEVQDFKNRQFIGADDVVVHQIQTSSTYDADITFTSSNKQLYIVPTFTANDYIGSLVGFEYEILINGQANWSRNNPPISILSTFDKMQQLAELSLAKRTTRTQIMISNNFNVGINVKVKVKANSISRGVLNVTTSVQ